ncbi:redoxin domain-containing protein [Maritimibacter harenae]|nr:redoxin domain-containing protein [Maritimibacter harenae]
MKGWFSMTMQFFAPRGADGSPMRIPQSFRRTVKWLPQIGDIFPRFVVDSTHGLLDFWDWADGHWVLLFSHPAANTPVCTTELGSIAANRADFEALGAKALGLTVSSIDEQVAWHKDIEDFYGEPIWFPTAHDPEGAVSEVLGMNHAKEHTEWPIRKSFIIDPQMRIRMIFEYPIFIGRSIEETLRVIEALQLRDNTGAATPGDWLDDDPVIIADDRCELEVVRTFGSVSKMLLPYLRVVRTDDKRFRMRTR